MINKLFEEYKRITRIMINDVKRDKDISDMMNKRQLVIEKISKVDMIGIDKEKIYKNLNINQDDAELEQCLKDSLKFVKDKINKAKVGKQAFSAYSSTNRQSNLFSRHV
ncbi:hypothetical protein KQI77_09850 [Clostridium sp. MSJ-8]|uniref:hypothetical protein n=1 Tax=Clostridium sp. MSJ-8 TaxID=2841510 RepID=UPI001C0EE003|nr:hypothetical protein [Clostridium sp. MSJ-8]MBU5488435.1 hypothetical protein [Clostridium sp. MSJ-8]